MPYYRRRLRSYGLRRRPRRAYLGRYKGLTASVGGRFKRRFARKYVKTQCRKVLRKRFTFKLLDDGTYAKAPKSGYTKLTDDDTKRSYFFKSSNLPAMVRFAKNHSRVSVTGDMADAVKAAINAAGTVSEDVEEGRIVKRLKN